MYKYNYVEDQFDLIKRQNALYYNYTPEMLSDTIPGMLCWVEAIIDPQNTLNNFAPKRAELFFDNKGSVFIKDFDTFCSCRKCRLGPSYMTENGLLSLILLQPDWNEEFHIRAVMLLKLPEYGEYDYWDRNEKPSVPEQIANLHSSWQYYEENLEGFHAPLLGDFNNCFPSYLEGKQMKVRSVVDVRNNLDNFCPKEITVAKSKEDSGIPWCQQYTITDTKSGETRDVAVCAVFQDTCYTVHERKVCTLVLLDADNEVAENADGEIRIAISALITVEHVMA